MSGMDHRVEIGRYQNETGFKGWIGTPNWIAFERSDGALVVFNGRTDSGAVVGDPVCVLPEGGR